MEWGIVNIFILGGWFGYILLIPAISMIINMMDNFSNYHYKPLETDECERLHSKIKEIEEEIQEMKETITQLNKIK